MNCKICLKNMVKDCLGNNDDCYHTIDTRFILVCDDCVKKELKKN